MDISAFWGKTGNAPDGAHPYKPVVHHLLDVAAVALRLQQINATRTVREAKGLGVSTEALARTSAYLAGLHDLGKFAKSFQCKVPGLWPTTVLGPIDPKGYVDRSHWRSSAILLRARPLWTELSLLFPALDDGLEVLLASVAGHHGQPPDAQLEFNCPHATALNAYDIGEISIDAGLQTMHVLRQAIEPHPIESLRTLQQCHAWSWRLAGLTTLADWIGSDSAYFEFEDPSMPASTYWGLALERAGRAIHAKGLKARAPQRNAGLATIAPNIPAPRPMQVAADAMHMADGPVLAIIEDTTGSGKTEAALALAARMIAAGKAEGLYFALPTMATANAMYGRLAGLHRRLFSGDAGEPSLVLAHGKADLAVNFLKTIGLAKNGPRSEDDTAAWCSDWIADSRRKAFFADVGAGTIDQAFLSVLKKKHLTLRQYGLAGRVLIVDEAHAFDAYMFRELETLLQVHAALGGSAIVLSATLPRATRSGIVDAFLKGLALSGADLTSDRYPLLTYASRSGVAETEVEFSDALRREVTVERVAHRDGAHAAALAAAAQGAAVLLIRNAVDEAIGSFAALSAIHADTHLFHARFALCDRQRIEDDVVARFGRDADPTRRAGHVLVATQVVEQSLDLDFDLVVSDLAPIDLLIQRAGRLWRHMDRRPVERRPIGGPRLLVIAPDLSEATREKWLEPALGRGAFVYGHPGVMWRTATCLAQDGAIRAPTNLRELVTRVYDDDTVPEPLLRGQNEAEGKRYGQTSLANANLIKFAGGYGNLGGLSPDQEIGTRLGEKTVILRLARLVSGKLVAWAASTIDSAQSQIEDASFWTLSEVTVRSNWLGDAKPKRALTARIDALRATWPEWERGKVVGVVTDDGSVMLEGGPRSFAYSIAGGLRSIGIASEQAT